MNKKTLVLISKCCLLLAILGFCLPVVNWGSQKTSGFGPIPYLLNLGPNEYSEASAALKAFEEEKAGTVAELKKLKASVKEEIKEYKESNKYLLTEAKAEKKVALAKAKLEFNNRKPFVENEVASIQDSYKVKLDQLESLLASVEKMDNENDRALAINEIGDNYKSENLSAIDSVKKAIKDTKNQKKLDIEEVENASKTLKKSDVILARKIYTNAEALYKKNIRNIENKYWDVYDAEYGMTMKGLKADKKDALRKILVPIALIVFFASCLISIIFTGIILLLNKSTYKKAYNITDMVLYIVIILSSLYAFNNLKKISTAEMYDVSLTFFHSILAIAVALGFIVYLFSTTLEENISSETEERRAYWMLSLPAIIFYFAVMTFPTIFSIFLSLTNYGGGSIFERHAMEFVGFKNYIEVFQDHDFYVALLNNVWIVLISVFGQLPLGFLLAYVLNRGLVKGRDFFQTMIYLPCVISTVVIGILFNSFFNADGAWIDIMKLFNKNYEWHMNGAPMVPVLIVMLWMYTGTYLIIFLANLQKIDPSIIEAATIDGATEGQVLWHVIFPQLSGTFVISAILAISGSLKSFDLIYVMTGGGPAGKTSVLSLYMFNKAFNPSGAANYPVANTISTIMVIICLILIAIVKTLEKKFAATED